MGGWLSCCLRLPAPFKPHSLRPSHASVATVTSNLTSQLTGKTRKCLNTKSVILHHPKMSSVASSFLPEPHGGALSQKPDVLERAQGVQRPWGRHITAIERRPLRPDRAGGAGHAGPRPLQTPGSHQSVPKATGPGDRPDLISVRKSICRLWKPARRGRRRSGRETEATKAAVSLPRREGRGFLARAAHGPRAATPTRAAGPASSQVPGGPSTVGTRQQPLSAAPPHETGRQAPHGDCTPSVRLQTF